MNTSMPPLRRGATASAVHRRTWSPGQRDAGPRTAVEGSGSGVLHQRRDLREFVVDGVGLHRHCLIVRVKDGDGCPPGRDVEGLWWRGCPAAPQDPEHSGCMDLRLEVLVGK